MDIKQLLELLGITSIFQFAEVTHAVSLTDTYWTKLAEDNSSWASVSPYRNSLNKQVSHYAFTSEWKNKLNDSNIAPEYTTDGSFQKCWTRENGIIYLCKFGCKGARNLGLEPYSELYTPQIAKALAISNCVQYTLHQHQGRVFSKCALFTSETVSLTSVAELLQKYGQSCKSYSDVLKFLSTIGVPNVDYSFRELLLLDCLSLNIDRHFGNIGVLYNADTWSYIGLAPIFDNNLALLPYYMTEEGLQPYLNLHKFGEWDSDIVSKTGEDFVVLGKQVLTEELRGRLRRVVDFEFETVGAYNLPHKRLKELGGLVRKQAKEILKA